MPVTRGRAKRDRQNAEASGEGGGGEQGGAAGRRSAGAGGRAGGRSGRGAPTVTFSIFRTVSSPSRTCVKSAEMAPLGSSSAPLVASPHLVSPLPPLGQPRVNSAPLALPRAISCHLVPSRAISCNLVQSRAISGPSRLAEDDVLTVKPVASIAGDEELAPCGDASRTCHGRARTCHGRGRRKNWQPFVFGPEFAWQRGGREGGRSYLPISPHISPHLPISCAMESIRPRVLARHISSHLLTSPHISSHPSISRAMDSRPGPVCLSVISPHISPYLPISRAMDSRPGPVCLSVRSSSSNLRAGNQALSLSLSLPLSLPFSPSLSLCLSVCLSVCLSPSILYLINRPRSCGRCAGAAVGEMWGDMAARGEAAAADKAEW